MRLPAVENAYVEERKIKEYLLSFQSARGKHKAAFFTRFGFTADSWEEFASALVEHGGAHDVHSMESNPPFGTNYTIEGVIRTPDGRNPTIHTVWEITADNPSLRLITAYPA